MNPHVVFVLLAAVVLFGIAVIALGCMVAGVRRAVVELACELERRTEYRPLEDPDITPMNVCRDCGADELVVIMASCTWVEDDLCSSCADDHECDERAAGEWA